MKYNYRTFPKNRSIQCERLLSDLRSLWKVLFQFKTFFSVKETDWKKNSEFTDSNADWSFAHEKTLLLGVSQKYGNKYLWTGQIMWLDMWIFL